MKIRTFVMLAFCCAFYALVANRQVAQMQQEIQSESPVVWDLENCIMFTNDSLHKWSGLLEVAEQVCSLSDLITNFATGESQIDALEWHTNLGVHNESLTLGEWNVPTLEELNTFFSQVEFLSSTTDWKELWFSEVAERRGQDGVEMTYVRTKTMSFQSSNGHMSIHFDNAQHRVSFKQVQDDLTSDDLVRTWYWNFFCPELKTIDETTFQQIWSVCKLSSLELKTKTSNISADTYQVQTWNGLGYVRMEVLPIVY